MKFNRIFTTMLLLVALVLPATMSSQTNPTQTVSASSLSSQSNGTAGYLSAWFNPSGTGFASNQLLVGNVTNPASLLTLNLAGGAVTLTFPTSGTYAFAAPGTFSTTFTSPLPATQGGTGVANLIGSTITLGGPLTFAGAYSFTGTLSNTTAVTFPTSGTLLSDAAVVTGAQGGTGVANSGKTITLAGNLTTTGAFNTSFTQQASTTLTLPATNTTLAGLGITQTFTGVNTFTPTARTSGAVPFLTITTPADTAQTTTAESIGINVTAATRTWAAGNIATQREIVLGAPTFTVSGGASTITTAVNLDVPNPIAGASTTLTNIYALRAADVLFTGIINAGSGPTAVTDATGKVLSAALNTVAGANGGTGVANTGLTITLAGNLVTTGGFNTTFAQQGSTTVTLPTTSSTMARTDAGQTFTGVQTFTPGARGSGAVPFFVITTPADTAQTTATESIGISVTAATRTWAAGSFATQREVVLGAPTYTVSGGASTITTAINLDVPDPIQGATTTLTNIYSLRAANVLFTGLVKAGSGPTTLTDAAGKILSAALNTVTIGVGGTGIANVNTQTVTTAGSQLTTGTCQAQTDVVVTGMTTAGVCVVSLAGAPPATWQTGVHFLTQAKSAACAVWICNGTGGSITPDAITLNVRGIL